jgi:hypothetical protein
MPHLPGETFINQVVFFDAPGSLASIARNN